MDAVGRAGPTIHRTAIITVGSATVDGQIRTPMTPLGVVVQDPRTVPDRFRGLGFEVASQEGATKENPPACW